MSDPLTVASEAALDVGVVVIGRNEGARLVESLMSALAVGVPVVYVDSDSSDGSAARASEIGCEVVELRSPPGYTAARARNAGYERLQKILPGCRFVHFVDGDCVLVPGWVSVAAAHLREHGEVGIVCGRLLEEHPTASPYHRLASIEWDQPVGDVGECGGIAMVRAEAFEDVGGYEADMPVGEDPDFCRRVGATGMRIVRLDRDMARHDIDMFRFSEWWLRQVRPGKAWADTCHRRGAKAPADVRRNLVSTLAWGGALPALCLLLVPATSGASLLVLAGALATLWVKVRRHALGDGRSPADATLYATACTLGKFAALQGVLRFARERIVSR